MAGLWRNQEGTSEGKYLVTRRDGTVPEWQWFVLGEADPNAPAGLRAYADQAERNGCDSQYVADVRELADEWEANLKSGAIPLGDPDAGKHRADDPATIERMREAQINGGGSV